MLQIQVFVFLFSKLAFVGNFHHHLRVIFELKLDYLLLVSRDGELVPIIVWCGNLQKKQYKFNQIKIIIGIKDYKYRLKQFLPYMVLFGQAHCGKNE